MEIAKLTAKVEVDDRELKQLEQSAPRAFQTVERSADRATTSVESLGNRLDKLDTGRLSGFGQKMTAAVSLPIAAAGLATIKMASDMAESQSKVQVVFGASAAGIEQWSKTAKSAFGQSRQEALESAGSLGALFTAMQIGTPKAAEMSKTLVQLSGDLASFKNTSSSEAMTAIQAGLVGESEPLRRFGISLSAAKVEDEALRLGLAQTKGTITDAAKAQAAFSLILQQSKSAQGDYARTSDGVANSARTLKAEVADLGASVGEDLLPIAKDLLKTGHSLIGMFNELPAPVRTASLEFAGLLAVVGPLAIGVASVINAGKTIGGALGIGRAGAAAAGAAGLAGETTAIGGTAAAAGSAGAAGALAIPAAILAGGAFGGYQLAAWKDRMEGKSDPGVMATFRHLNPFRTAADDDRDASVSAAAAEKEVRERWKTESGGLSPRQAMLQAQRESANVAQVQAAGGTPEELQKARDSEFSARLASAKSLLAATAGEDQNQREAKVVIPILTQRKDEIAKRAAELKPLIGKNAEAEARYWALDKEQSGIQEDISRLRTAAAKEAADARKKAAELAEKAAAEYRQLQQSQFEGLMRAAGVRADAGPDGTQAQAALKTQLPLIQQRQKQLESEAAALLPEARTSQEAAKHYLELHGEYWSLQADAQRLQEGATREIEQNQKAAQEAQKKQVIAAKKEAEQFDRFRTDLISQYKDAARTAEAAFQKANSYRLDFQQTVVSLEAAKAKNNPFLNDRQRGQAVLRPLERMLFETYRPVQGESELDAGKRSLTAEGIKGQIVEALGGWRRLGRGGAMQLDRYFGQVEQQAQSAPFADRALADAQRAAKQAEALAPRPVVMQIMLPANPTAADFYNAYQRAQQLEGRNSSLMGGAGF